jgi:hypothetical protein
MATALIVKQMDTVQGMLHKSVMALAIVPTNRSLTVTGRKAYSVMLHLAQMQAAAGTEMPDGGFAAPLNSILRGFGATNSISNDAKKYIDQMVSTKVEWRPLSKAEQQLTLSFGAEKPDGAGELMPVAQITDELRIFNLLAEVRIYKRAGENWVTWYYPPSIREELVSPSRWAQVDFAVLRQLTTYCAVALYEMCARYRDSPAGVTSRQHWTWWTEALRSSPNSKVREWRKFKNEFVTPAIKEINEQGDIEIELVEFRRGREVELVQFAVKKCSRRLPPLIPAAPDVTNILRGGKLGIRDTVVEELERVYGVQAVGSALDRYERFLGAADSPRIGNAGAYLRTIIINQAREQISEAQTGQQQPVDLNTEPQHVSPPPSLTAHRDLADAERHRRYTVLRDLFATLDPNEQAEWVRRVRDEAEGATATTPGIMKRLARGEWQSPLVHVMVIQHFARTELGEEWAQMPAATFETRVAGLSEGGQGPEELLNDPVR